MKTGFFAYSGQPKSSGDSIEEAIKIINDAGNILLTSWKTNSINGKTIIEDIIKAIDNADYFCADLTGLSDNVIFELGYAISKNKSIFLILDSSHTESIRKYNELSLLTTTGHKKYINSFDIVESFNSFLSKPVIKEKQIKRQSSNSIKPLLFIKSQLDSSYSRAISTKILDSKIPCTIDDASESSVQPVEWYLEHLNNAVLLEFSSVSRQGYELQNSKCSLVAGLAFGYGLNILMLAEKPYEAPVDYRNVLITYEDKKQCEKIVSEFLEPLKNNLLEYYSQQRTSQDRKKQITNFQRIKFGEFLAEHEIDDLSDYYVETFNLDELIKNDYNIVIGRKGTGKTATLYYLKNRLEKDARNHVCLIKPMNLEIDSLVNIMQVPSEEYERGYVVQSVWKFLIYTEIAKSVYLKIEAKPLYALDANELEFKQFVEENSDLFLKDFSDRLEEKLEDIRKSNMLSEGSSSSHSKIKLAEIIHEKILAKIRNLLSSLFEKEKKIVVLIDNLDKSWKKNNKLDLQSEWILGLLSVTGKIFRELSSFTIKGKQRKIDFHLTVFLRSDIFKYIIEKASEPDKIEYTNLLKLGDKDILFRIIEERFVALSSSEVLSDNLWDKYIVKEVENVPVKEYIYEKLIPRPRDIIYFFRNAHENAVSRGHSVIEEEDVKTAYKNYSSWFFTSMMVENGITITQLKEFLYQLVECPQIVEKQALRLAMSAANLPHSEEKLDYLIEHLSSLSLLGKEVKENIFEFEYAFDSKDIINVKAKRLGSDRYKIHNALVPLLELSY